MRHRVRALGRTLGPARDRDVSLLLLSSIEEAHPESGPAVQIVRRQLERERAALGGEVGAYLDSIEPAKFVRKIGRAVGSGSDERAAHAQADPRASDARWRISLAARLVRRARQLERAVDRAGGLYARDRLHAVRVAVKKLRYSLELGHDTRLWRWGAALRSLKEVQEGLGQLQDREALLGHVRDMQSHAAGRAPASGALDELTRSLEAAARQYHAEFLSRRARLARLCSIVRRQVSQAMPIPRVPARAASRRLAETPAVHSRPRAAKR